MAGHFQRAAIAACAILVLLGAAGWYWIYTPAPAALPGPAGIRAEGIESGGRARSYLAYIPRRPAAHPALMLVFHGWQDSAAGMRLRTSYRCEHLAEKEGFLVLYPEGFGKSWNDCRKGSPVAARSMGIDDTGFAAALVERFRRGYGVDE